MCVCARAFGFMASVYRFSVIIFCGVGRLVVVVVVDEFQWTVCDFYVSRNNRCVRIPFRFYLWSVYYTRKLKN